MNEEEWLQHSGDEEFEKRFVDESLQLIKGKIQEKRDRERYRQMMRRNCKHALFLIGETRRGKGKVHYKVSCGHCETTREIVMDEVECE